MVRAGSIDFADGRPPALGLKLHTGRAILVALAGEPGDVQILFRGRIELLPADESVPRFVYHEAAELPLPRATALVKIASLASQRTSRAVIKNVLRELEALGARVDVCGVLSGSKVIPDDLSRILRSHPLIHAAEGALFERAVVLACENQGLTVTTVREREVWARAAAAWGMGEAGLRKESDGLRKSVGAPWSAHKSAATAALLVLKPDA